MKHRFVLALSAALAFTALASGAARADSAWDSRGGGWVNATYPDVKGPHYDGAPFVTWATDPSETRSAAELRRINLHDSGYDPRQDFDQYGNMRAQ